MNPWANVELPIDAPQVCHRTVGENAVNVRPTTAELAARPKWERDRSSRLAETFVA